MVQGFIEIARFRLWANPQHRCSQTSRWVPQQVQLVQNFLRQNKANKVKLFSLSPCSLAVVIVQTMLINNLKPVDLWTNIIFDS